MGRIRQQIDHDLENPALVTENPDIPRAVDLELGAVANLVAGHFGGSINGPGQINPGGLLLAGMGEGLQVSDQARHPVGPLDGFGDHQLGFLAIRVRTLTLIGR